MINLLTLKKIITNSLVWHFSIRCFWYAKIVWQLCNNRPNAIMALVAVLGLPFVICEVVQMRKAYISTMEQNIELSKQNQLYEKSLRQSYRPTLCAETLRDTSKTKWEISFSTDPDNILIFKINLSNQGKGVLLLIGNITYTSDEFINARDQLLFNELDDCCINFKSELTKHVKKSILPNDNFTNSNTYKAKNKTPNYCYSIYIYEDQDGNLYDTVHIDHLIYNNSGQISNVESNEDYYYYSDKEDEGIIRVLHKLNYFG